MSDLRGTNFQKGLQGEQAAETYLCSVGMRCLDRRVRSPWGEIDLVMMDGNTLVFVEVKARSMRTLREAQLAVSPAKQHRLIQTALFYLNEHSEYANRLMRFDIVCLSADCIQHLPNAFEGRGW